MKNVFFVLGTRPEIIKCAAFIKKLSKFNNVKTIHTGQHYDYLMSEVFLKDLNLEESGLNRLIRTGFNLLDLITFFTVGPKETRAWTIKNNSTAPEAAGIIHTDFQKGFIRAETISYDDYLNFKSEQAVKDAGRMRVEGADYIVKDGDVFHFRFNV